ncbi:hypothetical protein CONCODRAFT_167064 [Conidiobolus coronatus NRRL 28638]|uniref:Fungal-type protein kinase domain-containing protein n=1 Tax=Conidiobolus coronatus (strain ATCC 28846 / CBS 209.66 / NRRL 28638) TaxID=796925 RepID=A0A137NYW5_CONC2|nr:hypothetical protein CONCODRAFT_167064 [Conidiobolus coronatus NRRL 28638]|eukprot:KXN67851.1 hypothetical protein CONCODRAFT_167064 [Conidiobolus coronatus NRRL 28638]
MSDTESVISTHSMEMRKRSRKTPQSPFSYFTLKDIKSTSHWDENTASTLNIKVKDSENIINTCSDLKFVENAKELIIDEWKDENWLISVNVDNLNVSSKNKTIINKIKKVHLSMKYGEWKVEGFMNSIINALGFDDHPHYFYPNYECSVKIGTEEHEITSVSDFGVFHNDRVFLIIENKTIDTARYNNSWKEHQVLGELFVSAHNVAMLRNVKYPIELYALRVVGTLFTFYKSEVSIDYIKETLKGFPLNYEMEVLRHPPIGDSIVLQKYDYCSIDDRKKILDIMCKIGSSL